MYPAVSIIAFTTFSGIGFGLLAWLGIGQPNVSGLTAFVFFALAYVLASGGLIASTFHLGHPERAMRAFSQWKTSWLSREAWCAVATLLVMAAYGAGRVFWGVHIPVLGWIGSILALLTVYCTSMIYAQLKTVPRWNTALTPLLFLTLALGGGALLAAEMTGAVLFIGIAGILQVVWWHRGDSAFVQSGTTLASATGLGTIGSPRAFEPPHTGNNYLLREMVHVVGRKHALKLRTFGLLLGCLVPLTLLLLPSGHTVALIAVLSHVLGVLAARWLFFAEAEHVVGLYYGKR